MSKRFGSKGYAYRCCYKKKCKGSSLFFKEYRESGFIKALEKSKEFALETDMGAAFGKNRRIKRKRHFDENLDEANASTQ